MVVRGENKSWRNFSLSEIGNAFACMPHSITMLHRITMPRRITMPHSIPMPHRITMLYRITMPHHITMSYSIPIYHTPIYFRTPTHRTPTYRTPTHRTLSCYFRTFFPVYTASTVYNANGILGATLSDISNWIMIAIFYENSVNIRWNIRWEFGKIRWEFGEHFSIKPRPTFKFGNIHEYTRIHPECEVS